MKNFLRYFHLSIYFIALPLYASLTQDLQKLTSKLNQLRTHLTFTTQQKYSGTYSAAILLDVTKFKTFYPYTTTGQPGQKLKNLLDNDGFQYLKNLGNSLSRTKQDKLHLSLATFTILVLQNKESEFHQFIFQNPGLEITLQNILKGPLGAPIRNKTISLKFKQFTVFQRFLVAEFTATPAFTDLVKKVGTELQKVFPTAYFKFAPENIRPHISLARFHNPLTQENIEYLQQHLAADLPTTIPDMILREPLTISVTQTIKTFDNPLSLEQALQA